MKTLFIITALLCSSAAFADPWTTGDTWREASYAGLLALDCGQTRYIAQHPGHYAENDPLVFGMIGRHPSTGRVDNMCAATALAHVTISALLPRQWREGFQYFTIGAELYSVGYNYSIGIRVAF